LALIETWKLDYRGPDGRLLFWLLRMVEVGKIVNRHNSFATEIPVNYL
jgi:hypothetical protein